MADIKIELLDCCGGDNEIANTARVSMELEGEWSKLPKDYTVEQRNGLIRYLAKHKHTSPFRHNSITVRCKAPIFLARQLGKHQVGMSWNEVSRRYVDKDFEFFDVKELWRKRPEESIKQGSGELVEEHIAYKLDDMYSNLVSTCKAMYDAFISAGVAPEQARMLLPQSMMTEFVWTGSLMAFAHVYNLRKDSHAQKEAQDFATALDAIISPLFPVSWAELTKQHGKDS